MIDLRHSTLQRLRDRLKETGSRPSLVVTSATDVLARFGLLPAEEAAAVQELEPLIEMMFLVMAADGELSDDEKLVIRGAVRHLSQSFIRTSTLDVMLDCYQAQLADQGPEARLQDIAARLSEDRPAAECAFVAAAAVALADEKVHPSDIQMLHAFAQAVGITEEQANELLDELDNDWDEASEH